MAENPHGAARPRPLSPFMTIYRWPVTMATSITHRATGVALSAGTVLLAWWLIAIASGPETYQTFCNIADSIPGKVALFGFTWALAYHLLNGIRHLAWDMGYGFHVADAKRNSILIYTASIVLAIGAFIFAFAGRAGFNA